VPTTAAKLRAVRKRSSSGSGSGIEIHSRSRWRRRSSSGQSSNAVRVTVTNGAIAITVNGAPGDGPLYPTQTGMVIPPNAPPQGGELTVGDDCPEDNVVKPSELQIDELRISNVSRTDLPLPPLLPPLGLGAILAPVPPPVIVPLRANPALRF